MNRTVNNIYVHPKYRHETAYYDVAIMELSMPFEKFNKRIWPVCLPLKKNKNINHLNGRVGRLGAFGRNTNLDTKEGQDGNISKQFTF